MDCEALTQKKQKLESFRPFPIELVRNLDSWFQIELTYTSNALEGNTLSRSETALIVEKGLTVGGKSLEEHLEAANHAKAFDWIKNFARQTLVSITELDILKIHEIILKSVDDSNAGIYRKVSVRILGSRVVLPNPLKVSELMTDFIRWLIKEKNLHPVELAAAAHYRLVTIHPFVDGNGRTARLLMNLILIMHGYPPAIIRKKDRLAYINSLEKAQLGGSKDSYFQLIIVSVDRSLDIYLEALHGIEKPLEDENQRLLKIGQLAKKANEPISTIRYWTNLGLIKAAEVTLSGYQLYDPNEIKQVRKIQQLKKKRYTLDEIKKKLS